MRPAFLQLNRISLLCLIILATPFSSSAQDGITGDILRDSSSLIRGTGVNAIDLVRETITIEECFGRNETIPVRECDEVWFVNARDCHNDPGDLSRMSVSRLSGGKIQISSLANLTSAHLIDSSKETVVYVHGNQTDERWSVSRGMRLYKNIFSSTNANPVRLVIWQWKSEREYPRLAKDYLLKSCRSIALGKTFAMTINSFQDRNLTVIGYSLGAQVTLAALLQPELGAMGGCGYRVAIIAPALSAEFPALIRQSYGCRPIVDKTKVFFNNKDRVLRLSELIAKKKSKGNYVSAMNLICSQQIPLGQLSRFNAGPENGKRHSITRYSNAPTIKREVLELIESGCMKSSWGFGEHQNNAPVTEFLASDDTDGNEESANGSTQTEFVIADPIASDESEYVAP